MSKCVFDKWNDEKRLMFSLGRQEKQKNSKEYLTNASLIGYL